MTIKKTIKKTASRVLLVVALFNLIACATSIPQKEAPCDAFGQHCDPKIPINQWRTAQ